MQQRRGKELQVKNRFSLAWDTLNRAVRYYNCNNLGRLTYIVGCALLSPVAWLWLKYSWLFPGPVNRREIRVFAMHRSGHHAIINWIIYQVKGRHCFLNGSLPDTNPFASCKRGESITGTRVFHHSRLCWNQETSGRLSKKGVLIYNYEGIHFKDALTQHFEDNHDRWLGQSVCRLNVLILRDPFNFLASKLIWEYYKRGKDKMHLTPRTLELWKVHAWEFLGVTNYLRNKVTISFNKWFVDQDYRMSIASALGLQWSDRGLNRIAKWGPVVFTVEGKGTFDSMKYDGKAQEMKVFERWKKYQDDPIFLSLLKDDELFNLSERIFGYIPGTEILQRKVKNY